MRRIDQKSINISEKIDNDFMQSYWLALQFVPTKKKQTQPDFYRGMPQASHGISSELSCISTSYKKKDDMTCII